MTPKEYEYLKSIAKNFPTGDVIIAGTMHGEDVRSILSITPKRNIVVIDSFEGLAPPVEQDICDTTMVAGECNIGGVEEYKKTFEGTGYSPPKEIYKMWISKDELANIPKREISILFLDLDHYQPTKDCLEVFFSWVMPGGVILVHDYDFVRCPGIKKCCDEFGGIWDKVPETGFGRRRPDPFALEVGSGVNPNQGYCHLDINDNAPHLEICASCENIPLPDNCVSNLLSINTLEHIEWTNVRNVIKEWGRLIVEGGTIKIHVPDIEWLSILFKDKTGVWKRDVGAQPLNAAEDKWEYLNHYIMSTDAPYNMHRSVYTEDMLRDLLYEVGFEQMKRIQVDSRWLYVEAVKTK